MMKLMMRLMMIRRRLYYVRGVVCELLIGLRWEEGSNREKAQSCEGV
jgi:hypothetical protein